MRRQRLFGFMFLLLILPLRVFLFFLLAVAQSEGASPDMIVTGPGQRYTENIPVIDIRDFGYQPMQLFGEAIGQLPLTIDHLPLTGGGGSDPNNPYAVIRKTAATFLHPGATARYQISLANYESITHTYWLTDTLPPQLTYVPDSATSTTDGSRPHSVPASDLTFDPATRSLTWQGELSPGHLDTIIEENSLTLPYLDLADFGVVNLCDDFIANGEACDDVTVTFNLGGNGYTTNLYGEVLSQLTMSSNGLVLGSEVGADGRNLWLPDTAVPGLVLAGLWRDVDMTNSGRFHAAIISGLVAGHDVFYAQWHDAPNANDPDLTARHAIAVLLNKDAGLPAAAHLFFIYDNISDPAQMVSHGYTIGIADKSGGRGVTYAYAPCCGDPQPPQGYPPTAGATLYLRPVLFGAANEYHRTFSYEAIVNAQVPETITNTAVATSSSSDPALAHVWSTHYLYVRWQTYIPFLHVDEVAP
ncbi:MAG TPA: hypothetical protein PLD25_29335 [Chloroflexota bacterium]|nr:hypothetical protein [Chloroflexota bacterium]